MFKEFIESLIGENYGGGFYKPDPRDYKAEHLLGGATVDLPSSVLLLTAANNQGASVHCSSYAAYHTAKILNEAEHKVKITDLPERGWALQTAFGTSSAEGDYISSALKSIVKNGFQTTDQIYKIDGYASVDLTIDAVKQRLAQGYPLIVLMPVTKNNFREARDSGIWTGLDGQRTGGHFTCICGYEPGFFIVLNSYGSQWGRFSNGTFKVPESKISDLQCCYLLYDHKDVVNTLFKDVSDKSWAYEPIKWLKDNDIVSGYEDGSFRPETPITRAEVAKILFNYHKKFNS